MPDTTDLRPLKRGAVYTLENLEGVAEPLALRCSAVTQRHWSRVCLGTWVNAKGEQRSEQLFVKQNHDRAGNYQRRHWMYERQGVLIAQHRLLGIVDVPLLRYQNEAQLLNVFDYVPVISMDRLLRHDPVSFESCFAFVMGKLLAVLNALARGYSGPMADQLPVKRRHYAGEPVALNFKGFDIRNVGLRIESSGAPNTEQLHLFDFGRPYFSPVQEAAAKLLISIGLLNWGKPLRRFLKGPDPLLLSIASHCLEPYLNREAVRAELKLQQSFRLKKFGLRMVGTRYFRQLERWCDGNISGYW